MNSRRRVNQPLFLVMARWPEPGHSKTRMIEAGGLTADGAAAVAEAMIRCTLARYSGWGEVHLGLTPLEAAAEVRERWGFRGPIHDQGRGALGERIWRVVNRVMELDLRRNGENWPVGDQPSLGEKRPVVVVGGDSPDIPAGHLRDLVQGLEQHDLAIGGSRDGGYWGIAMRGFRREIFEGIDWGTESVYDRTIERAGDIGLSVHAGLPWWDIDFPSDLEALCDRLSSIEGDGEWWSRSMDRSLLPEEGESHLAVLKHQLDTPPHPRPAHPRLKHPTSRTVTPHINERNSTQPTDPIT